MWNRTLLLVCALLLTSAAAEEEPRVRALFDAFRLSEDLPVPYDTGRLKIFYPEWEASDEDTSALPVVIFIPGGFVEYNRYQWLAERIVREDGVIFVLYDALVRIFDMQGVLPSSEIEDSRDQALSQVFELLEQVNEDGTLAGRLDLQHVILGGHSFGGRIALVNADKDIFPGVTGVFSYGAHMAAGPSIGYPPASIIPLNGTIPILLLGGTLDGVIFQSNERYDTVWNSATEPVARTYNEALDPERPACLVEFEGFNHFSIVDPVDTTVGSVDLDFEATVDEETAKNQLGNFISLFVRAYGWNDAEASERLGRATSRSPHIARGACKG